MTISDKGSILRESEMQCNSITVYYYTSKTSFNCIKWKLPQTATTCKSQNIRKPLIRNIPFSLMSLILRKTLNRTRENVQVWKVVFWRIIKQFIHISQQIYYEETITYVCSDETHLFSLWGPDIWKSLVERMDFLYVSGSHVELLDETRGKICGSIMMTTAALKYQSAFSTFILQPVRSRPQERLVESLKQGLVIWMLSSPSKRNIAIIAKK